MSFEVVTVSTYLAAFLPGFVDFTVLMIVDGHHCVCEGLAILGSQMFSIRSLGVFVRECCKMCIR
ncbi:hypothetical protein PSEUDO8Z_140142 [Pseudomonas sp. 8Z]|nr:hypothetical protein PSEUDO8Z_140142 [Pseudomonas sp. 8Z]